jgi:hypothetical protein
MKRTRRDEFAVPHALGEIKGQKRGHEKRLDIFGARRDRIRANAHTMSCKHDFRQNNFAARFAGQGVHAGKA